MAEYYLISQLPSLDGISENEPLPITQERFLELCSRFLRKKAAEELEKLTIVPPAEPERSCSKLISAWNTGERQLRLALGKTRADKMNKPFDMKNEVLPTELYKVASLAVEAENPLEAENILWRYRLHFLELLRPTDPFSEEYIFYYGLKLKLLERIRQFDTALGETVYKNIYVSILDGDRREAQL